jgi:hypothetical protein
MTRSRVAFARIPSITSLPPPSPALPHFLLSCAGCTGSGRRSFSPVAAHPRFVARFRASGVQKFLFFPLFLILTKSLQSKYPTIYPSIRHIHKKFIFYLSKASK